MWAKWWQSGIKTEHELEDSEQARRSKREDATRAYDKVNLRHRYWLLGRGGGVGRPVQINCALHLRRTHLIVMRRFYVCHGRLFGLHNQSHIT